MKTLKLQISRSLEQISREIVLQQCRRNDLDHLTNLKRKKFLRAQSVISNSLVSAYNLQKVNNDPQVPFVMNKA
jgi:hypothetical protein